MKIFSYFMAAICFFFSGGQARGDEPLEVVHHVDLNQYLGTWYEIARIDHRFQKGCLNSMAEYSLYENGDIRVVNSCDIIGKKDRKRAVGRAWVTDKKTNAKLRVQFVLTWIKLKFLSGNYWILDLGDAYEYAIVGDPSREYLWFLSRTPAMDTSTVNQLVKKAQSLGFDTKRLVFNASLLKEVKP